MKKIAIQGGYKLRGAINISGSKNASLPILAATLLIDQKIILENVPIVKDILTMVNLLETLALLNFASKGPITKIPARIVFTSSYFAK